MTVYEVTYQEYGAAAWNSAFKTTLLSVYKLQNKALGIITGAVKTTLISAMEKVTGLKPLHVEHDRDIKAKLFTQIERSYHS